MITGNPKKIVLFCFNRSGVFQFSFQLAVALGKIGTKVLFITSRNNNTELFEQHENVRVVQIVAPHTAASFAFATVGLLWKSSRIWKIISAFQPNIIHITDAYPWYLFWGIHLRKYPVVVTIHDPQAHAGEKYGWLLHLVTKRLVLLSKAIVVHGKILREQFLQTYKYEKDKVTIIPLGNFDFYTVWKSHTSPVKNSLLFFGRIVPYKGLDVLLDACEILLSRGIDFTLTIAGEGELTPYMKDSSEKLKKNITIHNRYIEEKDVAHFFESHETVVLPYKEATQSGVIPIAFAFERSIIATSVGAIPEVIRHKENGILVPPNSPKELADAIQLLFGNDQLRQQLASEGLITNTTKLSWPIVAEEYNKCYDTVL
jgi:starch synthase